MFEVMTITPADFPCQSFANVMPSYSFSASFVHGIGGMEGLPRQLTPML